MEILANLCLAADTRGDHSDVSSLLVEPSSERLVKILLLTPIYGIEKHCEMGGGASKRHDLKCLFVQGFSSDTLRSPFVRPGPGGGEVLFVGSTLKKRIVSHFHMRPQAADTSANHAPPTTTL